MKESNIHVGNATIKQQKKEVFVNTKGQYMKELDSHAGIVSDSILLGKILQSTKEIFIHDSPARQKVVLRMNTIKYNIKKNHEDKVWLNLKQSRTIVTTENVTKAQR